MDIGIQDTVRETFDASNAGRMHFGEVISRLMSAGVASYTVDYRRHCTTYYLDNDETVTMAMEATPVAIAHAFTAEAVLAAIRGAQRGEVMYPEFKRLTMAAGCIGYTVWITGRHVVYLGRKGETHVEYFPD